MCFSAKVPSEKVPGSQEHFVPGPESILFLGPGAFGNPVRGRSSEVNLGVRGELTASPASSPSAWGIQAPIKMHLEPAFANSGRGPVAGRCEKSLGGNWLLLRGRTNCAKKKTVVETDRSRGG